MAKADILKFRELLLSDPEFQEKLRKAAEEYNSSKGPQLLYLQDAAALLRADQVIPSPLSQEVCS